MIDPNAVSTIRVGELSPEPFSLTDNVPHEVGTELKRGTIEDLATFISAFIGSSDGVGFRAISVTDGQTLPTTTQQEFILVGKGTYYNVVGGSTIICTEELNAIVSNGSYWFIGVEIPVNVELAGITQFIRDGFINTTPSEDTVFDALALKANVADSEDVTNKISDITGYSTALYPNEKATHDALDLKLNISDLPTNLTLYPTTATGDVSGYVVMVKDIHDVRYNSTAVDVSTPTITGVGQLISQRISDAGVLIGQPGVFNITTFGNIRHLSGSGSATFYFEVYHRDLAGVETLICTSSTSEPVVDGGYSEFTASGLWDDGDFVATDRIVIKSYANRIAGGSDPVYQFQFGGASPVRTLLPVPFSVVDAGYELKSNKQNDLTPDGTGTKYSTVDAVNAIDLQKVLDVGADASVVDGDNFSNIEITPTYISVNQGDSFAGSRTGFYIDNGVLSIENEIDLNKTSIKIDAPTVISTLNFPAKTVAGTYTLATTDETVNLTGDQTITGSKTFDNTQVILYGGASNPLYIQANNVGAYIENLSTNDGLKIENTSSGDALNINGTNASTGKILKVTNNSVETLNISKEGNVSSNINYIKSSLKLLNSDADLYGDISLNLDRYLFNNKSGNLQFLTQNSGFVTYKSPTISGTFSNANLTENRTFTLPDATGTIPIVSQTITNGVTDKSPSEDVVFDALANVTRSFVIDNIPSTTVTLTVSETILKSYLIPANTFSPTGNFKIPEFSVVKGGTLGALNIRIYINTSNTLTGAVQIARLTTATNAVYSRIRRSYNIYSGNIYGLGFTVTNMPNDITTTSGAMDSTSYDVANAYYIITTATLANMADSATQTSFEITN